MFYYIKGTLEKLTGNFAVIDCGGVGYRLGISLSTGSKLSSAYGKQVLLYTYMAVREDNVELFGFYDEEELELFKRLVSVSGIGPKGAMSVLGTLSPDGLRSAVLHGDAKTIAQSQGIGIKTAQRIIIELKDRLDSGDCDIPNIKGDGEKLVQVVDTLALYGFTRQQVVAAVKHLDPALPVEELIAMTLRELGKEGRI